MSSSAPACTCEAAVGCAGDQTLWPGLHFHHFEATDGLTIVFADNSCKGLSANSFGILPGLLIDVDVHDKAVSVDIGAPSKRLVGCFHEDASDSQLPFKLSQSYDAQKDELLITFRVSPTVARFVRTKRACICIGMGHSGMWEALRISDARRNVVAGDACQMLEL